MVSRIADLDKLKHCEPRKLCSRGSNTNPNEVISLTRTAQYAFWSVANKNPCLLGLILKPRNCFNKQYLYFCTVFHSMQVNLIGTFPKILTTVCHQKQAKFFVSFSR